MFLWCYILEEWIFSFWYIRLCDLDIPRVQTVENQIRRCILRQLIWVCTVCIYSFWGLQTRIRGWLGEAKVSYVLHYWDVQLILAYSWARPAIIAAGGGRGEMFLLLLFLHFHSFFPSPQSLSFISSTISSISLLPFSGRQHKMTHMGWCVFKPQHTKKERPGLRVNSEGCL